MKNWYCIYKYRGEKHNRAIPCESEAQAVEALCDVNSTTGVTNSRYRYCTEKQLPKDTEIIPYEDYEVGCY